MVHVCRTLTILACIAFAVAPEVVGAQMLTVDSAMIDVGGHRLFARWAGEGSVTIVLESGQGATSAAWNRVFPQLAAVSRTFAYDRAGIGRSELSSTPLSPERTIEELRRALRSTSHAGPYIVVGWSRGGLYARMFAHRYPDDVLGLVLIDPSSENTWDWVLAHKPRAEIQAVEAQLRERGEGYWAEWQATPQLSAAVRGGLPLPSIPVVILTATDIPPQPNWWDQAYRDHFSTEQRGLAGRLPNARLVLANGSGHAVQQDRPDLVVEEIIGLLRGVRSDGTGRMPAESSILARNNTFEHVWPRLMTSQMCLGSAVTGFPNPRELWSARPSLRWRAAVAPPQDLPRDRAPPRGMLPGENGR